MLVNDIPLELETKKGMRWCKKDTYICEQEPPCMLIDYVRCEGTGDVIDVIIRRAYITFYGSHDWIEHKQVNLCPACLKEQKHAREIGSNVRIHYIDPPTVRVLKEYFKHNGKCD
jgi:hypothetical protein